MREGGQNEDNLEYRSARQFPLWANAPHPGRSSGRGVFGTAVGPNVTPGCCCESLPGTVAKAVPGISFVFPQRRPRRGCAKKKR